MMYSNLSCNVEKENQSKLRSRPLQPKDKEKIEFLISDSTKRFFGPIDVLTLLNLSYICMGLENGNNLIAAMVLNNYPNLPSIPPWDWMSWMRNIYGVDYMTSGNTLWVHLAVYQSDYMRYFLDILLRDLFNKYNHAKFIIFLAPPLVKFNEWLISNSTQIMPISLDGATSQKLYVFMRHKYTYQYKMRAAVIEDNDDLVELIDTHSKRLRNAYGDFYIAEMLRMEPNRKIIVAEYEQETVAVMCLNSTVNVDLLNQEFELEVYNALKVPDSNDILRGLIQETSQLMTKNSSIFSISEQEIPVAEESVIEDFDSIHDLNIALGDISLDQLELIAPSYDDIDVEDFERKLVGPDGVTYVGMADASFSNTQLTYNQDELAIWAHFRRMRGSEVTTTVSRNMSLPNVSSCYRGESNCFCLELAASKPEHELGLRRLLRAGFELFPNRDYCVLSVPSTTTPFDLQTEVFIRVPPRSKSTFSNELYLVHRNALDSIITVRNAFPQDLSAVEKLLSTCYTGDIVLEEFLEVINNIEDGSRRSMVVICDSTIIGVAILSDLEGGEHMKSHYNISKFTDLTKHKPGCLGQLNYLCMSPIFMKHVRFVLLELHRLSDYSFLCYKISEMPNKRNQYPIALGFMLPVIPIKIPEHKEENDSNPTKPYACYINTPIYCGCDRIEVNEKVVVVGASSVALSFLIEMAFQRESKTFVTFNNLTLVSTHGLDIAKSSTIRNIMLPLTNEIDSSYLALISLGTYVNVIKGVMDGIHRKNKLITVNSSSVPYNILILTCGKQFPMVKRNQICKELYEHPNNVFIINTGEDVDNAISKLNRYVTRGHMGPIIIYGHTMEAYCTVQGLLKIGILPNNITFVLSEENGNSTFNDPQVEKAIRQLINNLKITTHQNYIFESWKFDSKFYNVQAVNFQSASKPLTLPCIAAFMYGEKDVSPRTFTAIHKAGLVYDGALVINPNFTTNDPDIYAAGTFTKYPRRYYADHMLHAYYNQSEIGKELCHEILIRLLSSRVELASEPIDILNDCQNPRHMLVPRFKNAVKISACLPEDINYFHIRKPGMMIPNIISRTSDDYGSLLITGDLKNLNEQGYFKLHLNKSDFVETITCLSKSHIQSANLTYVWGKHEQLLNSLKTRYKSGDIKDLYDFFCEPSMMAIYCSHFEQLEKEIMEIMVSLAQTKGDSVIEDVIDMLESNKWQPLTKSQQEKMLYKFRDCGYEKEIEGKVLEFLQENRSILPMYGDANMYNMVVGESENSPLFREL